MREPHNVIIKVNEIGQGKFLLDGKELRGVRKISVSAGYEQLTEVTISFVARVEADAMVFSQVEDF
jgi:hypothetical protein